MEPNTKIVINCRKLISNINEICDHLMSWILGHSGIDSYEKIDELTRAVSYLNVIGLELAIAKLSVIKRMFT